ncbi:uncharacterized protein LOC119691090 isoform X1 [Plutella xylostella]|uniref:uncharacterized protein LOC119694801 isoform X1 n=2 Tax=Plutella xylostella TaxID=51655 RepID=UPI002033178B|nr:uncharacterized protein LOC119694801 isoform X1 [Plutella xylostella]XP_048488656.1 uncharacterized protein LOC119691090 isoform X1 [Plutella xylostella]
MTERGFVKAQSDNLPKVHVFMMSTYLTSNPNFTSVEIKGVKALRSQRESYGDSAVGYVQVKREGNICTVKARITPEHNVRQKCYAVTLSCNEAEETILSVECEDCAAHKGGCKHALAFLAWLHRRSEDPPSTSVDCYWKKSKLSSVGTSLKFIKAKDICNAPKKPKLVSTETSQESFLTVVIKDSKEVGDTDNQLMKYFKEPSNCEKMSIHRLVSSVPKRPENAQEFIEFCKLSMDIKACEDAAITTVAQSNCSLWHELRYARITASKAYEAAHCKTLHGSLMEAIMGASKLKDTDAMKRGRLLENEVIRAVENIKKIKIYKCGILLNPLCPIMGASPDGENDLYSIEIKCPSSEKSISNYLGKNNEITGKCMAQVQIQMHFSKKAKALFCVAHYDFEKSKNVTIVEIDYDKQYCENVIEKCTRFWCDAIFPLLFK